MTVFSNKEFTFDTKSLQLNIEDDEHILDKRIATLLEYFLNNPDKPITREELNEHVWNKQVVSADAINQSIAVLRKALGGPRNKFITTIPKVGYRFSPLSKITILEDLSTTKTNNAINTEAPSSDSKNREWSELSFSKVLISISLIISVFLGWFLVDSSAVSDYLQNTQSPPVAIGIIVLPFENLSNDEQLGYLGLGLTSQIQHNLSRKRGFVVSAPINKTNFIESDLNYEALAKVTKAEYVLVGSVNKNHGSLKISYQLRKLDTGEILFSKVIDQQSSGIYDIQHKISREVSEVLSMTMLITPQDNNDKMKHIDFFAAEQLYIARAKIDLHTLPEINGAKRILSQLNERYPNTSEIMGFLVYAQYQLGATSNASSEFYNENVKFAKEVLSIDPNNYQALITLSNLYLISPTKKSESKKIVNKLLASYPGKKSIYSLMTYHLGFSRASCEELISFVYSIPLGIYSSNEISALKLIIEPCNEMLAKIDLTQDIKKKVSLYSYRLDVPNDLQMSSLISLLNIYKNNRHYSRANWLYNYAGAYENAKSFQLKLNAPSDSLWAAYTSVIEYLYDQQSTNLPSQHIPLFNKLYANSSLPNFSAALVKEAHRTQKFDVIDQYLKEVPAFTIGKEMLLESTGLMLLQYANGDIELSQQTARKLLSELGQIRSKDPKTYDFWKLAPYTFISAVYADDFELAADILNSDMPDDYPLWYFGKSLAETALIPWQNSPEVVRFLSKIERDRQRIRDEYSLQ